MRKSILNIVFLLWLGQSFGQENKDFYSVYFSEPQLDGVPAAEFFPTSWYGTYGLKENEKNGVRVAAGDKLKIDESGIFIEKNKVLSITREEVRENSKYKVTDGYLHGLVKNDSLPVALDGELYYFLFPSQTYLYETAKGKTNLFSINQGQQFLFFAKEGVQSYSATLVSKAGYSIELQELVYPNSKFDFSKVKDAITLTGDYPTYLINPDAKEWSDILKCFGIYDSYSKV